MPAPPPPPPPSKKERFARFISRIKNRANRSSSGSSLVVQTGFPTSLADLVVKNRAKFRKRKHKSSRSSDLDSTTSAAVRSESDDSDRPTITAVEIPRGVDHIADRGKRGGIGIGIWLGFLTLVLVTVGRKWVVAGITVLTFAVLALELLGVLKPGANQRKSWEILIEGFDLRGRELVSPIREIEIENHQISPQLERSEEILIKRRDLDPVDIGNKDQDLGHRRKSNRKHIFRKLFRKKNLGKKNEEASSFLDDSITSHEEVLIEEEKDGDGDDLNENSKGEFISFEASNEILEINAEDVNVVKDDGIDIRLKRWRILVFIVVVLLGLLGGKGVALVLTVMWYLFFGCIRLVWAKWRKRQTD